MLRHKNDATNHTAGPKGKENKDAGTTEVVITPFEAEMIPTLVDAAGNPVRYDRTQGKGPRPESGQTHTPRPNGITP